jgi:putative addiction module component (TIGR02574 family)
LIPRIALRSEGRFVAMSQQVEQLLHAALALSDEDQLQLVAALTAAVEERGLRPFNDSWLAEIQRRSAAFDAGAVEPIPWSEVKLRSQLRDQR